MPEELDQYQKALEELELRRKEYGALAAAPPEYKKPGFWRALAAIGTGAFGGSQYDRGGMQWGQQMGREIIEGPYQRKMNEHLKLLAAKRQGLDVAQEGVQTLGQVENWKQLAAQRQRDAEDRKKREEEKLEAGRTKGEAIYKSRLTQQSGNEMLEYGSRAEAMADPEIQKKLATGGYTLHEPIKGRSVFVTPTQETLKKREIANVVPLANQVNQLLTANPDIVKQGFAPVDMTTATERGAKWLENYQREIVDMIKARNTNQARAARGSGRGGEDPDTKQKRYEHNKIWENSRRNVASLTKQVSALQNRIATTQDENVKAALKENLTELQQNIAETLNSAYQEDPMMKPESMKQYKVENGTLVEVGKEVAKAPVPAPGLAQPKKMTDEIAEQFLRAAGGDQAKAEAAARAQGYTW